MEKIKECIQFQNCTVYDSGEEENYKKPKLEQKLVELKNIETIVYETPEDHHSIEPGLLSPFREDCVENFMYPQQKESEDMSAQLYFKTYISRTKEEIEEESKAPQRSEKWHLARRFCLTASDFGAAIGDNPYSSPEDCCRKKIWGNFKGNDATKWGTFCEPKAAQAFLQYIHKTIDSKAILHEIGVTKFHECAWLAVSPDGILEYTNPVTKEKQYDLVEYKCPTKIQSEEHPYSKYSKNTPSYYYAQMLGIWGYINQNGGLHLNNEKVILKECWFVVWQPKKLFVTKHVFVEEEWKQLYEKLRKYYFTIFLPALVWNYKKLLEKDSIVPNTNITV